MIESVAIILLSFLGQLNIVSENRPIFLTQFIKNDFLVEETSFQKSNWDYYNNSVFSKNNLAPLPYKINNTFFEINSKAAIAFDAKTDFVLYSKNSKEKVPIASLTKIMTALVVLENTDLNETVLIDRKSFEIEGRKERLSIGEEIRLENLLKIMLVSSNNIAATALANHLGGVDNFIELMNRKAISLGLKDTVFYNPTGLDQENINISTAYDIAQLVDYALDKSIIWEYSRMNDIVVSSLDGKIRHYVKNTNRLLSRKENIIGGKTGFTDTAGQCLVLVTNKINHKDNQIITVVLNAQDRFLETERLVDWVYENYNW